MRKIRLLLLIWIVVIFTLDASFADKISKDKALQIASGFFNNSTDKHYIPQNFALLRTSEDLQDVATKSDVSSEPLFYIIANNTAPGFVIVSADDSTMPILGYSLDSKIDSDNLPENMEKWLAFYRDQIMWAKKEGIKDQNTQKLWQQPLLAGKSLMYLETPTWNQQDPFYLQCPKKGTKYCVTGCVPTTIAEIMRYYKWPEYGTGYTSEYTCENDKTIKVPSRNLNHKYNWDNMPYSYSGVTDTNKKNEVATLMADLGAALQVEYAPDGTSGFVLNECLVKNFGYSSDMYLEKRNNYYDYQWIELLKSEIDKKRPLCYAGFDESDNSGHQFVLDGYDDQNYFHVNWGWGGYGNGYFLISALNIDKDKYNSSQDALFNFYPSDGSTPTPEPWINLYDSGIACIVSSFSKNIPFRIESFKFANFSTLTFNGYVALALTNKSGEIIELLVEYEITGLQSLYYSTLSSLNLTITNDIKPGYRIRAFYRISDETEWVPMWRDGASNKIKQEILVAEDIETPLDEATSLYFDKTSRKIIISTLSAVVSTFFDSGGNEVTEGITKDSNLITIDCTKLTGDKYKIRLQKDSEIKELEFSVKPIR